MTGPLSTRAAAALYLGALLGPGVLILPALAAEAAGPASVIAWAALLAISAPVAVVFAALGVRQPEPGGTAAYARRAFGPRAGAVTGWWFLAGVAVGAPAVALIGWLYVAELLGAGRSGAVVAAAGMIAAVTAANAVGLRATARLQLALAGVLAALGAMTVLYLGLAVATVGALGTAAPSDVPLADLMGAGLGEAGRTVTAGLAVLLTMGTMNAYVAAAAGLAGALAAEGSAPRGLARRGRALAAFAAASAVLLAPPAAGAIDVDALVAACSACFLAVYVMGTAAGARLLDGPVRWAARGALVAVVAVLAFSGPYLAVPAAVGAAGALVRRRRRTAPAGACEARRAPSG